jgi:hypothetical protein
MPNPDLRPYAATAAILVALGSEVLPARAKSVSSEAQRRPGLPAQSVVFEASKKAAPTPTPDMFAGFDQYDEPSGLKEVGYSTSDCLGGAFLGLLALSGIVGLVNKFGGTQNQHTGK